MKRLSIVFVFLTSGLFGQDNPMFDSLDYYRRNNIKTIYGQTKSWYYAPPWKKWQSTFDQKTNTLTYHSFIFDDTTSSTARFFRSNPSTERTFSLHDTIIRATRGAYNDTIRYIFDSRKRLHKKLEITAAGDFEDGKSGLLVPSRFIPHLTTTTYFYTDSISKKLKKIVTESPYYTEEQNFYYDQKFLSVRTALESNKVTKRVAFETKSYDYYPDGKLKTETRRVVSDHCPGICEGVIEYTYDTAK